MSSASDSKHETALPTLPARGPGIAGPLVRFLALAAFACAMAVPFCWMVMASVKPLAEIERPNFVPENFNADNYTEVLGLKAPEGPNAKPLELNFGRWYFNSLFVAGWVTFLQLVTGAMAAFAFSRLTWPGRDKVFVLYIATMMIPATVLIVPNFFIMVKLRLVNTYLGLILPAAFGAFGTFMLRQFMLTIPHTYDEAAEIDGAGKWRVFTDVVLPQCRAALITLAIFIFLGNYGSFFWPLIMIKDRALQTLPIGMLYFDSLYGRQTNLLMAASVMNVLPAIIVFVGLQKFLVRGIQLGALKG